MPCVLELPVIFFMSHLKDCNLNPMITFVCRIIVTINIIVISTTSVFIYYICVLISVTKTTQQHCNNFNINPTDSFLFLSCPSKVDSNKIKILT